MAKLASSILGLSLLVITIPSAATVHQVASAPDCTGFPAAYDDDGQLLTAFLDATQKWSAFEASISTERIGSMTHATRAEVLRENSEYVSAISQVVTQNIQASRAPRTRAAFQTLLPIYAEIEEINAISAKVMAAESVNDMQLVAALSLTFITSQARFLAKPVLDFAELQHRKDYVINTAIPHEHQLRTQARDVIRAYITDFRALISTCHQAGPLSRDY